MSKAVSFENCIGMIKRYLIVFPSSLYFIILEALPNFLKALYRWIETNEIGNAGIAFTNINHAENIRSDI